VDGDTGGASSSASGNGAAADGGDYTQKLVELMRKLQVEQEPAEVAVRGMWDSLQPADRARFSADFPQFMHYIETGPPSPGGVPAFKAAPPLTTPASPVAMSPDSPMGHATAKWPSLASSPGLGARRPKAPPPMQQEEAELLESREADWASRVTFHAGILRVDMKGMRLTDGEVAEWCTWVPAVLEPLTRASSSPLANADLDFSDNAIEDGGMELIISLLRRCNVHCARISMDHNCLTDLSVSLIADMISHFRLPLLEFRMEHNNAEGSPEVLLELARALQANTMYPVFKQDLQRYTPFSLYLAYNAIAEPLTLTQQVKEVLGTMPCLAEDRRAWGVRKSCPALQLPGFFRQGPSALLGS